MPWEVRRWVIFAILMFAASILALNYRPEGAPEEPRRDLAEEKPTIPLSRPGPIDPPAPRHPLGD